MKTISHAVFKIRLIFMNNSAYISYLRKQGIKIGKGCSIRKSVYFGSEPYLISIGDNVRITQNVKFITHDGGLWTLRHMGLLPKEAAKYGRISIGDNCNIGWNMLIMPNVQIGKNCVIGAGAVVTKSIPDGEIWAGVPAKKIETIEEYYEKVRFQTLPTNDLSDEEKRKYIREHNPQLMYEEAAD